jgi:hypothetical protein
MVAAFLVLGQTDDFCSSRCDGPPAWGLMRNLADGTSTHAQVLVDKLRMVTMMYG